MSERTKFNEGWIFFNGEIEKLSPQDKGPSYMEAKTERYLSGPASRNFPDASDDYMVTAPENEINERWFQSVTLPHDFIITQVPEEKNNKSWGYFEYHPAWYRKHFVIGGEDRGKRIVLYFEGVTDHATVYFNGSYMLDHYEGHAPFEVDITDFVRFDQDNILAVHVETGTGLGWWYQGGGIYRNVWLEKDDPVSVARYGVFVHPEKKAEDSWDVPVDTEVRNDRYTDVEAEIETKILAPCGTVVADMAGKLQIPARDKASISQCANVASPALWDIDDPVLYKAVTTVKVDGVVTDVKENSFGFRTLKFTADEGFFLNGRSVKVQGVCAHGDFGLTGLAVEESVFRYRAGLLKEMGANAYRCSHYPQAEYWMDEMDRKGILVMDETRWFSSAPSAMADLETMVKRDRNHPSVFMWSMGNEEPMFLTEMGANIMKSMYAAVKKLDPTRPVMVANDKPPEEATIYQYSDIIGINYKLKHFEPIHEMYPDKPIISSENAATQTTRGWYDEKIDELGRFRGYDSSIGLSGSREETWQFILDRPWIMGGMQWVGIEHRGESIWPRISSCSGALDLYLQRKDAFYQNQSHWSKEPMIHLLPHWNHPGKEGMPIEVFAYTNCEEVELILNGESLGKQAIKPVQKSIWSVPYAPGKLEAVGYIDGKEAARDIRETTGAPVALQWQPENADDVHGGDILILGLVAVDAEGRIVPNAEVRNVLSFANAGGSVIGTGSDNTDHVPPRECERRMFSGRIQVAVRLQEEGTLKLVAKAPGMIPAFYTQEIS